MGVCLLACPAQSRAAQLTPDIAHVDLVAGTQKFHRVADHVDTLYRRKLAMRERLMDDERFSIVDIAEEPGSQSTIREHTLAERQSTAFVSIMQGCNMRCTFCIVPDTRGAERAAHVARSEEHTSELQSLRHLVCRLLLEKKKKNNKINIEIEKTKKSLETKSRTMYV